MNIKASLSAPLLAIVVALITASCASDKPVKRPAPAPIVTPKPRPAPPPERPRTLETLINLSPTLTADLQDLKREGWIILYGSAELPLAYEGNTKRIEIPKKVMSDPDAVIQMLSHEVGHAKSGINADATWMTLEAFVDAKLRGEGAAVLKSIQVQRESKIPFTLTAGMLNHDRYYDIYDAFHEGEISESEARRRIGEIYRNGEYVDREGTMSYGRFYENQWYENKRRRLRN
jgi:type VI secretion system secreted protein VgrG